MAINIAKKRKIVSQKVFFKSIKETDEVQWPELIKKHSHRIPDSFKEELFLSAKNDVTRLKILCSIENDDIKIKHYTKFNKELRNDADRVTFCKSLSSDKSKETVLSDIETGFYRANCICTFKSEKLKKAYIASLEYECDKSEVVASFRSFKSKQSFLKNFTNEDDRAKIIASSKKLKEIYSEEINSYTEKYRNAPKFLESLKIKVPPLNQNTSSKSPKGIEKSSPEKFD